MGKLIKKKESKIVDLSTEQRLHLLEEYIHGIQHKVDFHDTVTQTEGWIEMAAVAKLLGYAEYGRNNLFKFLLNLVKGMSL